MLPSPPTTDQDNAAANTSSTLDSKTGALYQYVPVSIESAYDPEAEVPVFFQAGPGNFAFSNLFKDAYTQQFGEPPDANHRIDNT
jgi:hypothetical protein